MTSLRWSLMFAAGGLLGGPQAQAADRDVRLQAPPAIREDVAAMPSIADPADASQRRINAALRRLDANVRKAVAACRADNGVPTYWKRTVDTPMRGPGFLSYVINDDAFCGGAHPATAIMAIVYDLRTGNPVDWTHLLPPSLTGKLRLTEGMDGTRMVTLASARLYSLFVAGYEYGSGSAEDRAACKQAVQNIAEGRPPAMMAWLDAERGGLAVQYDLPHVDQACAVPVVIPVATLRADGARPALLDAVGAAHRP